MNYACILTGTPPEIVELAQEAEHAGWDGVFLPDDWMTAWITLTAIAMRTHRIHLGTMLTPLPEQLPSVSAKSEKRRRLRRYSCSRRMGLPA